jgi:hypothetical protein
MANTDAKKFSQKVFTLLVQVGRKSGDGLPDGASGGGLVCFATGRDEAEAVRETVATLKAADLAPLDVVSYGDQKEREHAGHEFSDDELELMGRAKAENAVIVALFTPFFNDDDLQEWQTS